MSHSTLPDFIAATAHRRSLRQLQATLPISDDKVTALAEEALRVVPSAFNSQTTRLTVLLHSEHKKLWSIAAEALIAKIGEERWQSGSGAKIDASAGAYGTILFWDDAAAVELVRESSPDIYKDKIDEWVHQSNGMHQYYLWTALDSLGVGVNVQHYNPLIDDATKREWDIPPTWNLRAQMVFGLPKEGTEPPERVQKFAVDERYRVFGERSAQGQL